MFVGHIHMSYFGATGTPVCISGDVSSGFQSQSGFCLIHIAEVNVMYIPWDPPRVLHIANLLRGVDRVHILPKVITGTSDARTRNLRYSYTTHLMIWLKIFTTKID